eukprot:SAG31_NODE_2420_length_5727_cov_2.670576_3_plen_75_part_00
MMMMMMMMRRRRRIEEEEEEEEAVLLCFHQDLPSVFSFCDEYTLVAIFQVHPKGNNCLAPLSQCGNVQLNIERL